MDLKSPFDIESLFRLAVDAVDDGWAEVESPMAGLSVWRRDADDTHAGKSRSVLFRTRFEQAMPPCDAVNLFRPEVFFHESRKLYDDEVLECGIEQLEAPGDALGFTRLRDEVVTSQAVKGISLVGTLSSVQRALHESGDDTYVVRQIRLTVRRDFPKPGMFAVARAPCNPTTQELCWEWGISKASIGVFAAKDDDPNTTTVTELLCFDRGAALSSAALAGAPRFLTFFRFLEGRSAEYRSSDAFKQTASGCGGYVVVTLRRCERGPPLLPCSDVGPLETGHALEWVQAQRYELPMYLRRFLRRIGVNDVEVYDRLDGRGLMPYQAVLEQKSWDRAWALLIGYWGKMQAAYRHTLGGVNAPQLRAGMAPRFTPLPEVVQVSRPKPQEAVVEVSVNKTFLHFKGSEGEADTSARQRVMSESQAEGCAQS